MQKDINPEKLYRLACDDLLCNTSYPLRPEYFSCYRTDEDIMNRTHELSFYIHVPFCKHLCSFCEYTRFLSTGQEQEHMYITRLQQQISAYLQNHTISLLHGLDIGGGTPTSLHSEAFSELLDIAENLMQSFPHADSFGSSIEFSFSTIDDTKIELIAAHGIHRMSTGIQVYDDGLMASSGRVNTPLYDMLHKVSAIRAYGIKTLNLDLMYGFDGQSTRMLDNTLRIIEAVRPEHVTLYEMRCNMNNMQHSSITRDSLFRQYSYLFAGLLSLGYAGVFGRNTFSLCDDLGVSSYLRSRMYDCIPYKGFGVSAQSMSRTGISYNILKSSRSTALPAFSEITEQDIYRLPPEEIAAKYVCIALYSGQFSMKILTDILGADSYTFYSEGISFLLENGLIDIENDICRVTNEGFRTYGAIASLFWSEHHKRKYIEGVSA